MRVRRFLVASLGLGGCGGGQEPTAPVPGFERAYASASCAPWDGYAVSLVLRPDALAPGDSAIEAGDGPQLRVALYPRGERSGPAPTGLRPGTFRWPDSPEAAIGSSCENSRCTTFAGGSVTIRRLEPDGRIVGSVELSNPEGTSIRGRFEAEWRPRRMFCL